jgi:hypothetical protein
VEIGGHSHFPARSSLVTRVPGMEGASSIVARSLVPRKLRLALACSSCMWYFLFVFYFICYLKKIVQPTGHSWVVEFCSWVMRFVLQC